LSVFLIDFAFCNISTIHFFLNFFFFLCSFNWIGDSNSQRVDSRDQNLYSFSQKRRKTALDLSLFLFVSSLFFFLSDFRKDFYE
jgi:hypothetical protein